jgi:type I restriction enzyme R subunit
MFHGFDCTAGISGSPVQRLKCLAEAIEWILARQHEAASKEVSDDARKAAHRRYQDAVLP